MFGQEAVVLYCQCHQLREWTALSARSIPVPNHLNEEIREWYQSFPRRTHASMIQSALLRRQPIRFASSQPLLNFNYAFRQTRPSERSPNDC